MDSDKHNRLRDALTSLSRLVNDGLPDSSRREAAVALRELTLNVSAVFDKSLLGIIRSALNGVIIESNPGFARMLGYSQGELSGRTAESLTHRDDFELEREMVRDAIRGTRDLWRMRKRYIHRDGRTVWGSLSVSVVRDEAGRPESLVALVEDITDRVRTEESLCRRDAVLEAVAYAAQRFLRFPGWESGIREVLGRLGASSGVSTAYISQNIAGEDGSPVQAVSRYVWQAGRNDAEPSNHAQTGCFNYMQGFARWARVLQCGEVIRGHVRDLPAEEQVPLSLRGVRSLVVVPITAGGDWWGVMGFDECKAEREWYASEADALMAAADTLGSAIAREASEAVMRQLATAVEQAVEGIVITDNTGVVQYVNRAFSRITGYSFGEIEGGKLSVLKSGRHDDGFYREMWETISQGRVWEGRIVNRRKDGSMFQDDTTISPIRDSGGDVSHFVAVKRDVTREVRMEEQLRQAQRVEALGLLSGGVAHDMGNVLTPIMAYSEMAVSLIDEASPAFAYVKEIQKGAKRAEELVKQLMAFGRSRKSEMRDFRVNDVVRGFEKMLARVLREDIELACTLDDRAGSIRGDAAQVEQALMNLAVNARDAMPSGGCLTIRTFMHEGGGTPVDSGCIPEGRSVVLEVQDTGCGMDQETKRQMFEPFFTTKPKGEGTGLGLANVYGIVREHGGAIEVETEPGRGTSFRLFFPEVVAAVEAGPKDKTEPVSSHGTETILLVEDDENVRLLALQVLEQHGYRVHSFGDPVRALKFSGKLRERVDLVLSDVVMPRMNGKDLHSRLAALIPGVKALYMSGHAPGAMGRYGISVPPDRFLKKPFTVQGLTAAVRDALNS
ncbi:MAG: PAS domain S-box protein [Lentisphaerae bacterium]|nr:PAS domain S-box protein [Lentisphaerota bacterium]